VSTENTRRSGILTDVDKYKGLRIDSYFKECNAFFVALMNNLNFMMTFYDKWILYEDFVKLPGDENVEKKHLNLKKLMIKKEKGHLVDTSSERSLKKTWKAFNIMSFAYKDRVPEIK